MELSGKRRSHVHIGTSGWHYGHWRGPFYAEDMCDEDYLAFYAEHFHTVEINNSFYRLPDKKTFTAWRKGVPNGFIFAVKASRYITHMKKLKDPVEPLSKLLSHAEALGDKLGPILFQLPGNWNCNTERLRSFLEALPRGYRYAFEFRDESWFRPQVYELLARHGAAFCVYDFDGRLSPQQVTADYVYVRLHGPHGAYAGKYSTDDLVGWARVFSVWVEQGKDVYCYFDNDESGYAPQNALELQSMLMRE